MNNEIGVLGGGELQLRINGAKAEVEEIKHYSHQTLFE